MKTANIFFLLFISVQIIISDEVFYNYSNYNCKYLNELNFTQHNNGVTQNDRDSNALLFHNNYKKIDRYDVRYDLLSVNGVNVHKSGGTTNPADNFLYCINSAILVLDRYVSFSYGIVSTTDEGAIGICALNNGGFLPRYNSILTQGHNSPGLYASINGCIESTYTDVSTKGDNSPALFVNNNSYITCKGCFLSTSGKESPLAKILRSITLNNCTGTSKKSQAIIIDNGTDIEIKNYTNLKWVDTDDNKNLVDPCLILIKNSSHPKGEIQNSNISRHTYIYIDKYCLLESTSEKAPIFLIDSSYTDFTLSKSTFKSKIFLKVKNTALNIVIQITDCVIEGDIITDEYADISISLDRSSFKGAINPENKAKKVSFCITSSSNATFTNDSYINDLFGYEDNNKNIIGVSFMKNQNFGEENSSFTLPCSKFIFLMLISLLI